MSIFKPRWESKNPRKRFEYFQQLKTGNPDHRKIIEENALKDPEYTIRMFSYKFLSLDNTQEALADIAMNDPDVQTCKGALDKLTDQEQLKVVVRHPYAATFFAEPVVRIWALKKIADQDFLTEIALNENCDPLRITAVEMLENQNVLVDIARNERNRNIRLAAVRKITNEQVLEDLAEHDTEESICRAAVSGLTNQYVLERIAKDTSKSVSIRGKAVEGIRNNAILADFAKNYLVMEIAQTALNRIDSWDKNVFSDVAHNASSYSIRIMAHKKMGTEKSSAALSDIMNNDPDDKNRLNAAISLSDQNVIARFLRDHSNTELRNRALKYITDQRVLFDFIISTKENSGDRFTTALCALEKISDQLVLKDIVANSLNIWRQALNKLKDQGLLVELLNDESKEYLHYDVLKKLTDQDLLADIASNHYNESISIDAVERISRPEILDFLFTNLKSDKVRERVVSKLVNQDILSAIVNSSYGNSLRIAAMRKLTNQNVLVHIAQHDKDFEIRAAAVNKLEDINVLFDIAKKDNANPVREAAIQKITDQKMLKDIAQNEDDCIVLDLVIRRLNDVEKSLVIKLISRFSELSKMVATKNKRPAGNTGDTWNNLWVTHQTLTYLYYRKDLSDELKALILKQKGKQISTHSDSMVAHDDSYCGGKPDYHYDSPAKFFEL